jgi:uncharacterized protein YdhG (YjbR/CyaY superfamily)
VTVDEYVRDLPEPAQAIVEELRRRARRTVPAGVEAISYGMPVIKVDGRTVIHFAAWKRHIAVYPVPADPELAAELGPFRAEKGTLRFDLTKPIPYDLIERIFAALAAGGS